MTFSCKNCEGKQKLPEQLQRNATLEEERGVRRGEQRQSEGEEEKRERERKHWGQAGCGTSKLWLTSTCSSQATRQAQDEGSPGPSGGDSWRRRLLCCFVLFFSRLFPSLLPLTLPPYFLHLLAVVWSGAACMKLSQVASCLGPVLALYKPMADAHAMPPLSPSLAFPAIRCHPLPSLSSSTPILHVFMPLSCFVVSPLLGTKMHPWTRTLNWACVSAKLLLRQLSYSKEALLPPRRPTPLCPAPAPSHPATSAVRALALIWNAPSSFILLCNATRRDSFLSMRVVGNLINPGQAHQLSGSPAFVSLQPAGKRGSPSARLNI